MAFELFGKLLNTMSLLEKLEHNSSFLTKRLPLILFLTLYVLIVLFTYKDYGIGFDEHDVYLQGKWFYTKVRGNDAILQRDFVIKSKNSNKNLLFYDSSYATILYMINGKESYEIYHLINLLFASLLFIAIYELLLKEFKRPLLALTGAIFLFLMPFLMGQVAFNPKDVPFAILYFISLTLTYLLYKCKCNELIEVLLLGLSFGLTASLRAVGYTLYVIYFLFRLFVPKFSERSLYDLFLKTFTIFLFGFLIQMISIPYVGADPFNHFLEILKISKQFPWKGTVLVLGRKFVADNVPWYYLPVWIGVTTPLFILFLSILSFKISFRKNRAHLLFVLTLVVNLFVFYLVHPTVYDGYRHMLFLAPILVFLASEGFSILLRAKSRLKSLILLLILVNMVVVVYHCVKLHPYEYAYFNELVGGTRGAYKNFEIDWWGTSVKEATLWLNKHIRKKSKVAVYGPAFTLEYFKKDNLILVDHRDNPQYIVAWERFDEHKKFKNKKEIYTVKREGVPLVHVYKVY